jgi:hypothetical protein
VWIGRQNVFVICVWQQNCLLDESRDKEFFMENFSTIVSVILSDGRQNLVTSLDATISKVLSGTRTWTSHSINVPQCNAWVKAMKQLATAHEHHWQKKYPAVNRLIGR